MTEHEHTRDGRCGKVSIGWGGVGNPVDRAVVYEKTEGDAVPTPRVDRGKQ